VIAALFVEGGGVYFGLPDVDPWDARRDARRYAGPHAVVAHPPCERWGRYWFGGPSSAVRREKGDDDGCFEAALEAVRKFGGVLEHPEGSAAWPTFGLIRPLRGGGWSVAADGIGWTCCVEQGHYGHAARKATWLYAAHVDIPRLTWGPAKATARIDSGSYHSHEERQKARAAGELLRGRRAPRRLGKKERAATPIPFRDLLLSIARTSRVAPGVR
jgi:hypothetical protein